MVAYRGGCGGFGEVREKGPPLTNGFAADSGTTVSEVREDCALGRSRRTESNPKWRLATLICPSFRTRILWTL